MEVSGQGLVNMTFLLPFAVLFGVYEVKEKGQGRNCVYSHIIKDVTLHLILFQVELYSKRQF